MAEEVKPTTETKKGFPKILIVVVVVLVVLSAAGYYVQNFVMRRLGEKIVGAAIGQQTGSKVDINSGNGTFKVQNKDGSLEVGTSATWPNDMPGDVPKFSGGSIAASIKSNTTDGKFWTVTIKDASADNVSAYKKELGDKGWQMESEVNVGVSMVTMKKNDLTLNLAYDGSSKGVTLTVEKTAASSGE